MTNYQEELNPIVDMADISYKKIQGNNSGTFAKIASRHHCSH